MNQKKTSPKRAGNFDYYDDYDYVPYKSSNIGYKWDTHKRTDWNWTNVEYGSYFNRAYESNVKTPDYYVLPPENEIGRYAFGTDDIKKFKDYLYLCYYANIANEQTKNILKKYDKDYEEYYDIAKLIATKKLSILQSAAVLQQVINQQNNNDYGKDSICINTLIDSLVERQNSENYSEMSNWVDNSEIDFNKDYISKAGVIDKMCLFEDFGEKFKIMSEDFTKFVQNSKHKKNTLIQKYEQITKVRKFEHLLPTFDVRLLTRSLNVSLPIYTETAKQKLILLLDYSGSMGTIFKQEWVTAIILNRIKYIFDNDCELYFSRYERNLIETIKYVKDEEEARLFWSSFETKPNRGGTNIHNSIISVEREFNTNPKKYASLNGKAPEILVVCDGEDSLNGTPLLKTNIVTILNYNKDMRKYAIESGGTYVNISQTDIKVYNSHSGLPLIL